MNIDVIIKDFSFNNRFPVIGVIFINNNLSDEPNLLKKDLYYKRIRVGSHFNIEEAITRCFTEEMQGFNSYEYECQKRIDLIWKKYFINKNKEYKIECESYGNLLRKYDIKEDISYLEDNYSKVKLNELKSIQNADFLDDIKEIVSICKRERWDFFVIDSTHPKLDFPVVRVIIPNISDVMEYYFNRIDINKIANDELFFDLMNIDNLYRFIIDDKLGINNTKIIELIDTCEAHLSKSLEDNYINLSGQGLKNISVFSLLAWAYYRIGNIEEAKQYQSLNAEFNKVKKTRQRKIYKRDKYARGRLQLEGSLSSNPFINECTCNQCRFYGPKNLYELINAFII